MRLLAFGTYDVHSHPRVGVLIQGLRSRGHEVTECNAPLGIDTAGRVSILQQPWRLPVLAWRLARCWWVLARRARRLPAPEAVLVGYLGHFDVLLARRLFPDTPVVLDHLVGAAETARDRGAPDGFRTRLLARLDRAALTAADLVVVDTEEQRAALPLGADRAVVVPVGAEEAWFAAPRDPATPLRVVFFGLYTPLQGATVIGSALALLRDAPIEVTMVGSGQDRARAQELAGDHPRVRWLDWVASADLPGLVAGHDVCLGIFGTTPKALRVVPTKVYQGAASGCAVVTSDTAPQRRVLGDAAMFVPPGNATALAAALATLAEQPHQARELARRAHARAVDAFAPAACVQPLTDRLATVSGLRP